MRISDWSSDVCSSDLFRVGLGKLRNQLLHIGRFTHGSIELAGRITYPAKIRAHSNQAALYAGPGNSRDDFIIAGAAMQRMRMQHQGPAYGRDHGKVQGAVDSPGLALKSYFLGTGKHNDQISEEHTSELQSQIRNP